MTDTPLELAVEIATRHNLLWRDVCGPRTSTELTCCRRAICRELATKGYSISGMARLLNRSRATIAYYLDIVTRRNKACKIDRLIGSVRDWIREIESVQDWSGTGVGAAIDAVEKICREIGGAKE